MHIVAVIVVYPTVTVFECAAVITSFFIHFKQLSLGLFLLCRMVLYIIVAVLVRNDPIQAIPGANVDKHGQSHPWVN